MDIVLCRVDLKKRSIDKSIKDLVLADFLLENMKDGYAARRIVFIDNDRAIKVIKDRWNDLVRVIK